MSTSGVVRLIKKVFFFLLVVEWLESWLQALIVLLLWGEKV